MKILCNWLLASVVLGALLVQFPAAEAQEKTVYRFGSRHSREDASEPNAGLINVNGTLYGTTIEGGDFAAGTVYSLDPSTGAETVLHSFAYGTAGGAYPYAGLIDVKGTLYGTTLSGGSTGCAYYAGCGTVFSLKPDTGREKVVYTFQGGTDGGAPHTVLIHANGTLYGTTGVGGGGTGCLNDQGCGTVFALDAGTGAEAVLYSFCSQPNCTDGGNPISLIDVNGTLYGETSYGGGSENCSNGCGTVFSLDPGTGAETVLHVFGDGSDGAYPDGTLINVNGTLYGTTYEGGGTGCLDSLGCGTVFSLKPDTGDEKVLYSFQGRPDGARPAGLSEVGGSLYGTTSEGGSASCPYGYGCGTAFSLDPGTGTETVLYSFCPGYPRCGDGQNPSLGGLLKLKGRLYGATSSGGRRRGVIYWVKIP